MRDNIYRGYCTHPTEYDRVIDWIAQNNPYAGQGQAAEDFAVKCVHDCIRATLFGDAGRFCSTGMCIAVRANNKPECREVVLAIRL